MLATQLELEDAIRLATEASAADATAHFVSLLDTAHLGQIAGTSDALSALYGIIGGDGDAAKVPFARATSSIKQAVQPKRQRSTSPFDRSSEATDFKLAGAESVATSGSPSPAAQSPADGHLAPPTHSFGHASATAHSAMRRRSSAASSVTPSRSSSIAKPRPFHPVHHSAILINKDGFGPITVCAPPCVAGDLAARAGGTAPTAMHDVDRLVALNHLFNMATVHVAEYEHLAALRIMRRAVAIAEDGLAAAQRATEGMPIQPRGPDDGPSLKAILRAAGQRATKNVEVVRAALEAGAVTPHGAR